MKQALAALLWAWGGVGAGVAAERATIPGDGVALVAQVYRPEGQGPFPAVVMLHGCSGLWDGRGGTNRNYHHWAQHLRGRGFMAVLVDSFGPRGEKEICTQAYRRIRPERERTADAYATLRWLAARPEIDADRIHLLGWSNGAIAALHAMRPEATKWRRFRSAVAFYPGCRVLARGDYRPYAPLLIQAGAADDWTPAAACEALVEKAKQGGASIEIDIYPEAHHAFDGVRGEVRFRPEVRNGASPTGWGATVGPHPEARERAWEKATRFLEAASRVPRGTEGGGGQIP